VPSTPHSIGAWPEFRAATWNTQGWLPLPQHPGARHCGQRGPRGLSGLAFGAKLRHTWRSWLTLSLLIALVSGFVLVAATAGRRYLLKDRVADVAEFADSLARRGRRTALDPEVVSQMLAARRAGLAALTSRQR
jgi:hypothetical protein